MEKQNSNKKVSIIFKIIVLFIIMPSLLAFFQLVGFCALYFSLTSSILSEYQNNLSFQLGLLNASIGLLIIEIFIVFKSLNYVFK